MADAVLVGSDQFWRIHIALDTHRVGMLTLCGRPVESFLLDYRPPWILRLFLCRQCRSRLATALATPAS